MFGNILLVCILPLAALTVGAAVVSARLSSLALPVPDALRILLILLPIFGAANAFFAQPSLSGNRQVNYSGSSGQRTLSPNVHMAIYTVANGIQGILTTVLATLFGIFMAPSSDPVATCRLETHWRNLWNAHDDAIRRVQDQLNCCGFRSPKDRSWPFSDKDQCEKELHGPTPCRERWTQELRANAGAAVAIIVIVGVLQAIRIVYGRRILRAMGRFSPQRPRDESRGSLLPPVEEGDEEEVQRDDDPEERRRIGYGGTNAGNGSRVQPSTLGEGDMGDMNEWRTG